MATGLMLIPQTRTEKTVAQEVQIAVTHYPAGFLFSSVPVRPLPPGCEDYELVSGDVDHARIFLLGEDHVLCNTTRVSCSKGLLARQMPDGIDPDQTALLFENLARDNKFACSEMGASYAELSNDCRGWNLPRRQRKHESWPGKADVLQKMAISFAQEFPKLSRFPAATQKLVADEHVQNWIDDVAGTIDQLETMVQVLIEKHGENYPAIKMKQIKIDLKLDRFRKKHLETIHQSIMADQPLQTIVPRLNKKIARYHAQVRSFIDDPERSFGKPNRAMAKAIHDVRPKKITVVYAGDTHVNPRRYQQEIEAAKRQKIIWELFEQLSHTNPYAVLSCTLR